MTGGNLTKKGETSNKSRTFLSCIPSLIHICLLSLETGVSEKLSLKVPSDVVEGSARAMYSVLGESASQRQTAVHLIILMRTASPATVNEDIGWRHWFERKSAKLRIALCICQKGG